MSELKDLVEISNYAGERFDLVQAGGGNSSVKYDNDEMIIKASGAALSDVSEDKGYSRVVTSKIASIVKNENIVKNGDKRERESLTLKLVENATLDKKNRPSIETLLHSFLHKYTLHTHPIVVNMVVIQKDYKNILGSIFEGENIAIVEYKTPGIELAVALGNEITKLESMPNIIFLQNHGLIVTSNLKHEIKLFTEKAVTRIEKFLKVDMVKYKMTNRVSYLFSMIEKSSNISYLSEDMYLNDQLKNKKLFIKTPFCPDSLVYCGISCCELDERDEILNLKNYKQKYFELPKVIIYKDKIFFIAENVRKAKEMEEVFKFHIMVLKQNIKNDNNFLTIEELAYLSNWEAETYRQKI